MQTNKLIMYGLVLLAVGLFTGYIKVPGAVGGAVQGAPQTGGSSCVLSSAQTTSFALYDADKPGSQFQTVWNYMYGNTATGALYAGNGSTQPGGSYTIYANGTATNFAALVPFTPGCVVTNPVSGTAKTYDQSITFQVWQQDGNQNGEGSSSTSRTNASITAGSTYNFEWRGVPSALYKHLAGPTGKYAVWINTTNVTSWDTSGFSIRGIDGSACVPSSAPTPADSRVAGYVIYRAICSGDFSGVDGNTYKVAQITVKAASGTASGAAYLGFWVAPVDYYRNSVSGAVASGEVDDLGRSIHSLQVTNVRMS